VILVDTSVWIDHLHKSIPALIDVLEREDALTHPLIVGELACGQVRNRHEFLHLLTALPSAAVATHEEAMHLIEERRLMGKGLGYIDVHLLASAMLTNDTRLWTTDKRLQSVAADLRLAFP
jgi:predicted nucleic acid-binding protein